MNPNPHQDLKDWKETDKRLRAFKESQWQKNFGFDPVNAFLVTLLFALNLAFWITVGLLRLTEYALR